MNLDALLDRARRIESETTDAANTARRVGSLLADLIGALRSISDDSLSSLVDDEARGHIIFARGLTSEAATHLDGGVQVGQGAASVDASGRGTLQSLVLREWLEVPELRLNRTAIHLGASLLSPGAGIVAEVEGDADDAELLIVGFGSTYGHLYSAMEELRGRGYKVALAQFQYINPLPANTAEVLLRYKKAVVAEQNLGQLAALLRIRINGFAPYQYNQVKGQPFMVSELVGGFERVIKTDEAANAGKTFNERIIKL